MLASFDPPDDDDFARARSTPSSPRCSRGLQGRPALALVCGSSETYQQAAMYGLEPGSWESRVLEETIPAVVERHAAGRPVHRRRARSAAQLPFEPSVGVAPLLRRRRVPAPAVRRSPRGRALRGRVPGVLGSARTRERRRDVRRELRRRAHRGLEGRRRARHRHVVGLRGRARLLRPPSVRRRPARGPLRRSRVGARPRARRGRRGDDRGHGRVAPAGLACAGGLVLSWRDLWPGAGWGLVDSLGRPKAPWYALAPRPRPVAVLVTDEGLSGLQLHVVNDRPDAFNGRLELARVRRRRPARRVRGRRRSRSARARRRTVSATRSARRLPRPHPRLPLRAARPRRRRADARIGATTDREREAFYLPLGRGRRTRLADLGLTARARRAGPEEWAHDGRDRAVRAVGRDRRAGLRRRATRGSTSRPGAQRTIDYAPTGPTAVPRGDVRALQLAAARRRYASKRRHESAGRLLRPALGLRAGSRVGRRGGPRDHDAGDPAGPRSTNPGSAIAVIAHAGRDTLVMITRP